MTNQISMCWILLVTGIQLLFAYLENHVEMWLEILFLSKGKHFMLSTFLCLAALWNWALIQMDKLTGKNPVSRWIRDCISPVKGWILVSKLKNCHVVNIYVPSGPPYFRKSPQRKSLIIQSSKTVCLLMLTNWNFVIIVYAPSGPPY